MTTGGALSGLLCRCKHPWVAGAQVPRPRSWATRQPGSFPTLCRLPAQNTAANFSPCPPPAPQENATSGTNKTSSNMCPKSFPEAGHIVTSQVPTTLSSLACELLTPSKAQQPLGFCVLKVLLKLTSPASLQHQSLGTPAPSLGFESLGTGIRLYFFIYSSLLPGRA